MLARRRSCLTRRPRPCRRLARRAMRSHRGRLRCARAKHRCRGCIGHVRTKLPAGGPRGPRLVIGVARGGGTHGAGHTGRAQGAETISARLGSACGRTTGTRRRRPHSRQGRERARGVPAPCSLAATEASGSWGRVAARAPASARASGSRAAVDDGIDRIRFGLHSVRANPAGRQAPRLIAGRQVQRQRAGAFSRDQRRELVAACRHHSASLFPRQARREADHGDIHGIAPPLSCRWTSAGLPYAVNSSDRHGPRAARHRRRVQGLGSRRVRGGPRRRAPW
jgi:hypothetical protein